MESLPLDFAEPSAVSPLADLRKARIGLALSGGGYRAATFHLGTLAYLHHIGLLPQLRRLSTVSGGTFLGAKYILSLVEGIEFPNFFRDFYQFLSTEPLIEKGLRELSQGAVRVPSEERKLITAMANVYADTFLMQKSTGEAYTFGQIIEANIPVQEVTFNATEFRTGIAFRFQKSENKNARIGNGNVFIPLEEAKKIRIADIVAASSCFPGGFEPMAFPDDFVWPNKQVPESVRKAIKKKKPNNGLGNHSDSNTANNLTRDDVVALMDGGIYDNQGISSLLLADSRNAEELDLFIISDVDPTNNDLFSYPQKQSSSGNLTLGQIAWLSWISLIICVLTVAAVSYELWREITQGTFVFWQHFFSALMPLTLASLVAGTLWYGRRLIATQLLPLIPQAGINGWKDLKTLKLNEAFYLISLRVDSLLALTATVFMDRIKALIFQSVYEDKKYHSKRISNRIDRLIARSINNVPGVSNLGEGLQAVITVAVKMPTTLWFDFKLDQGWINLLSKLNKALGKSDQQLTPSLDSSNQQESLIKALVIAGQATICFNLMQYISRQYGNNPDLYSPEIKSLWNALQEDWEILNDRPTSLLDKLLQS